MTYTMIPKNALARTWLWMDRETNQRGENQSAPSQVHQSGKHHQNQRTDRHRLHHHWEGWLVGSRALQRSVSNSHGNHLHVSTLQVAVELVLARCYYLAILGLILLLIDRCVEPAGLGFAFHRCHRCDRHGRGVRGGRMRVVKIAWTSRSI
jgi:hypothetical protein